MIPLGTSPLPLPKTNAATPLQDNRQQQNMKALLRAAEDFESIFALQMLRSMQSSLDQGSLFGGGKASRIYSGLGEIELARSIAQSTDLGIKEQLMEYVQKLESNENELKPK